MIIPGSKRHAGRYTLRPPSNDCPFYLMQNAIHYVPRISMRHEAAKIYERVSMPKPPPVTKATWSFNENISRTIIVVSRAISLASNGSGHRGKARVARCPLSKRSLVTAKTQQPSIFKRWIFFA